MRSHISVPVSESSQPVAARLAARDFARELKFSEEDSHRAGLVATELATNLVKHTQAGGEMLLRPRVDEGDVEILALDRGPGIADIDASMTDGHSTTGSPGTGLGAVRRIADTFEAYSTRGQGTVVLARVRGGPAPVARRAWPNLSVAGISVARTGESACGDGWLVRDHPSGPIVVIADGLGHGPDAAAAASAAMDALSTANFGSLPEALGLAHVALRPTRGAALSLFQFDRGAGLARFSGIGNVSGTICLNGTTRQAVSLNGTLGHEARTFREFSYPWPPGALFVMYSDGLISHWTLEGYPGLLTRDPVIIAAVLYRDFSRGKDDVTVVVGREVA